MGVGNSEAPLRLGLSLTAMLVMPFYCVPVLSAKILQTYSGTSYGNPNEFWPTQYIGVRYMNTFSLSLFSFPPTLSPSWTDRITYSKPHGQMDKLWDLHWRILAIPLMNITLEEGCLWRKSDLLCAFHSIFSLWLSV